MKTKQEIVKALKVCKFRDRKGHPLEDCMYYHALLKQATAMPVFGTAQFLAWLQNELTDGTVSFLSVSITEDESTLVVHADKGCRRVSVAINLQEINQSRNPNLVLASVPEAIRRGLVE